jgi:hypothetical protein
MHSRPAPAPSDGSALLDDFEWPPAADDVSVHQIDDAPWITGDADAIGEPDPPPLAEPLRPPHCTS